MAAFVLQVNLKVKPENLEIFRAAILAKGKAAQASLWSAAVGVTTLQGLEEALGHGPWVKAALVLGYGAGTFCAVTWSNRKKGQKP